VAGALLALDGNGNILLANEAAGALWRVAGPELIGEHFSSLFAYEAAARDDRWRATQWEALRAAATGPLTLAAKPQDGASLEVEVSLEKATAASGPVWLASIRPAATADLLGFLAGQSPVGFFDLNFKSGIYYYSPTWKKQLGYAESELADTFETWRQRLHPEDSAAAPDRAATRFFSGTRSFSVEYRLRHRDGRYVWILGIGLQVFGPEGEIERVVGVHLDITERRELEETAVEREERFQGLTGPGPLGAFDLDFAAGRHWFAPAWKRLLGYQADDLIDGADTLATVLHPDDSPAGLKEYFLARHPGEPAYLDLCRLRHKDGHYVWVIGGVFRHVSRKRELLRVLGFHCALPAELPVADGAAVPPALLAGALAELHEGLVLTDAAGRISFASDKAAQLLDTTPAALHGRLLAEVFPLVNRASGESVEFPQERLLASGEAIAFNTDHLLARPAPAKPRALAFGARPVADATGRVIGAALAFRDPEETPLTPDELVKANRGELVAALAGRVADHLNNLLTTILNSIALARTHPDGTVLADSEAAALAARGLTKELLALAKGGGAGRVPLAAQAVLDDAARLAGAGTAATVAVEVAPGTAGINADRAQVLQVFQNLVINAIEALPADRPGHVWLRAANVSLAPDQIPPLPAGAYVQFDVQDDGGGIPPENLAKVFDAYFTTKKHGTGSGLATALEIVRRHGGQIGVDSTPGRGTTFTLFLPQSGPAADVEARRAPTMRFRTGRVLFMDDDENICKLTTRMLESLEYKFDVAHKGEEAIALYTRYLNVGRPYDAVVMDLTIIGGLGGEETFKRLRELDRDVRAVISSGYDSEEMAKQYLDMGFCGYLTKPYRTADLGRVLKTVLG
jgi:PAS domain S-box-containing protein